MPETLAWVESDDTEVELSEANGVIIAPGMSGRFMPPVAHIEHETPGRDGSRRRETRYLPGELAVPVTFVASSYAALRTVERAWIRRLAPKRGEGKLRSTDPLGETREVSCSLNGSLGMVDNNAETQGVRQAVLILRAFDPFWYDTVDTETVYSYDPGSGSTFFPFFPLRLTASAVFAGPTIDNTGDVEAWPVWTVAGPVSDLTLENSTTGESLTITGSPWSSGNSVVIDTRPGAKTVLLNDSTNLFPYLTTASSLWALEPGENVISIEIGGADENTEVTLAYRRRWLSA